MGPKRHHYVPKFYLEYFFADGQKTVQVYDKHHGGEPRPQQPINTCVIGHYYSFLNSNGERETLEEEFSQLEGQTKTIFDRWQEPKAVPDDQDKETVAKFLALLSTRGPKAVRFAMQLEIASLVESCRELAESPEKAKGLWQRHVEAKDKTDTLSYEQFQAFLSNPKQEFSIVESNEKFPLAISLLTTDNILPYLLDRQWFLCVAPAGAFFVTSDTPVSVFEPTNNRAWHYGGFGLKEAVVAFPISPKICLVMSQNGAKGRGAVSEEFVAKMNMTTINLAERFVISPSSTETIKNLVENCSAMPEMKDEDFHRLQELRRLAARMKTT